MNQTRLDKLSVKAMKTLENFLDAADESKAALGRARIASSILSAWTRQQQTTGARYATNFMLARELAEDREELQRYVALAMPESPLAKQLQE